MTQSQQINTRSWKMLFDDFSIHLRSINYAINKNDMYKRQAQECILWMEQRGLLHIGALRAQDVFDYVEFLRHRSHHRNSERQLSASTVTHHIFSIKLLFDYCFHSGLLAYTIPFPKLVVNNRVGKEVLAREEVSELFGACEHPRDTAMLTLLYGCGLRRNEVYWLDTCDIHLKNRILYVQEGKRRKFREVPLSDKSIGYLREYEYAYRPILLQRKNSPVPETAYLLNCSGCRLTGDGLYKRLLYLAEKTNNPSIVAKKITPHTLRHSIATHMAEMNVDMSWIQAFLGHSTPDTTHIYTRRRKRFVQLY